MEKVVYGVRRRDGADPDDFSERLTADVAPRLAVLGARCVEVLAVDAAAGFRVATGLMPLPDALLSGWVDSANAPLRAAYDEVVASVDPEWFGWVVTESVPLRGDAEAPGRAEGYAQLAFLRRPPEHALGAWLAHWHGTHTQVAIETQSTTRYVQNLVVRPLTASTPPVDAIVEEVFPVDAMTDPAVFFDAAGDPERQQANVDRLMASVAAFLDFATIDVVPMSRYLIGSGDSPC
jgi:hypothetical protein